MLQKNKRDVLSPRIAGYLLVHLRRGVKPDEVSQMFTTPLNKLYVCMATILIVNGNSYKAQVPTMNEIHIATRVTTVEGIPCGNLSSNNFSLLINGRVYPNSIHQPQKCAHSKASAFPTRALILLPRGKSIGDPLVNSLADKLAPLWSCKWEVSVRDEQDHQTSYVSTAPALQAVLHSHISRDISKAEAFRALGAFAGRRVIVVPTGAQYEVDKSTIAAAVKNEAMIYRVGGISQPDHKIVGYQPDSNFMEFSPNGDVLASITVPGAPYVSSPPPRTIVTERADLDTAIKQAVADSAGFYNLTAWVPRGSKAVALIFVSPKNEATTYKITAQLYGEAGTLPELSIQTYK